MKCNMVLYSVVQEMDGAGGRGGINLSYLSGLSTIILKAEIQKFCSFRNFLF